MEEKVHTPWSPTIVYDKPIYSS